MTATENTYKTSLINNRRYLGNKYKLLSFITGVVNDECADIETVADIFAGTGAVSSAFVDKALITNDLMYSNYICNYAWFGAESYDQQKIIDYVVRYNAKTNCGENYMTRNFADTYFSKKDCAKIGYIREDIERNYKKGNLNNRERAILITSLLYAMDKIAVTADITMHTEKEQNSKARWNFMFPWLKLTTIPKINVLTRTLITLLRGLRLTSFI